MSQRLLVVLSLIGLAGAGAESILFAFTEGFTEFVSWWQPIGGLAGGIGAGVLAGIIVMSTGTARRVQVVVVSALSGLAALGGLVSVGSVLQDYFGFGPQSLVLYSGGHHSIRSH